MESQNQQAGNLAGFNAKEEKKAASNVLPAGDYELVIASCKMKDAKDYKQVAVELKVLNGECQNRVVFQNLSFAWIGQGQPGDNAKTALRIGRGTFGKICEAVGVAAPNDTSELVGKTFVAKLKVKDGKGEYEDQNVIAKASPRTAGGPAPVGGGAPAGVGGKW